MTLDLEHNFVLILTASVDPHGMTGMVRADPQVRERDYAQALRHYTMRQPRIRKIVFVENSGWPLDRLQAATQDNPHGKEIEFISLNCNDFPRHLGKSYGELQLLDQGIEQSKLAQNAQYLAKLTGRLQLTNLAQVLRVKKPFDLLCDLRDPRLYKRLGLETSGCDVRLLVFSRRFYEAHVRGAYAQMDDSQGRRINGFIHQLAANPPQDAQVIPRLPHQPFYQGNSGYTDKDYASRRQMLKYRLRGTARRLAPWLYI